MGRPQEGALVPPTPSDRLERQAQLATCRLCMWLDWLEKGEPKEAKGWRDAIANPRFSPKAISELIIEDQQAAKYMGDPIGESSVETHRKRHHS